MNTGRAGLCVGVLSLAASAIVLFHAEQVAARARLPRNPMRGEPLDVECAESVGAVGRRSPIGTETATLSAMHLVESTPVELLDWHPELNPELVDISVDDPQGRANVTLFHFRVTIVGTIEELQRELGLSRDQTEAVAHLVEATNLRIEDLLRVSAVERTSPRRAIDERWRIARSVVASVARDGEFLSVVVKPLEYRDWTVSGRNRTYGEEIDVLIREALALITQQLTPEQNKTFSTIDAVPLFTVPDGGGDVE